MKKLLWIFVCATAMTFAACGGNGTTNGGANDTDSVAVDSIDTVEVVDSAVVADSIVAE